MFSIMLVDDQLAILEGLATLIDNTGIAKVVATESDGDSAISSAIKHKPDLILLDASMGKVSGIDIARKLFKLWQDARVLAVSAHSDSVYVRYMLNVGASGFMLKDNGPEEMIDAITMIMDGGQWIGAGLSVDRCLATHWRDICKSRMSVPRLIRIVGFRD
ncbi:MAG: response regulator transcription factor [Gammaproteobacteria bacterium]|nr:response regulator transcription factor [Gammaproteobacteria bacterium]